MLEDDAGHAGKNDIALSLHYMQKHADGPGGCGCNEEQKTK